MAELYARLRQRSPIQLQWFIEGRDRDELIATFLGVLELVRLGGISLQQGELFGDILIAMTQNPLDETQFAISDQR
jgi:chromatin segregation and condensation protein Rec8/ScpA/Scc1 (kleisin family)